MRKKIVTLRRNECHHQRGENVVTARGGVVKSNPCFFWRWPQIGDDPKYFELQTLWEKSTTNPQNCDDKVPTSTVGKNSKESVQQGKFLECHRNVKTEVFFLPKCSQVNYTRQMIKTWCPRLNVFSFCFFYKSWNKVPQDVCIPTCPSKK